MSKIYRYKDLSYLVEDETDVVFTVEFVSDGNSGQTIINIPGPNDPEIENSGNKLIGKGKDLRNNMIVCISNVANLIPEVKEIIIRYKINGDLLKEHSNLKSEEERPLIILNINFPNL